MINAVEFELSRLKSMNLYLNDCWTLSRSIPTLLTREVTGVSQGKNQKGVGGSGHGCSKATHYLFPAANVMGDLTAVMVVVLNLLIVDPASTGSLLLPARSP